MRARHVVFLESHPQTLGGSQRITELLASHLPRHGWTTEVVSPLPGPVLDRYGELGIRTTVLRAPSSLHRYGGVFSPIHVLAAGAGLVPWWVRLARHLRRSGADLFDASDQRGALLACGAGVLARVPWVWHVQARESSRIIEALGRTTARRCIVASRGMAAGLRGHKQVIVPQALPEVPPDIGGSGSLSPPRIVAAGRLHPVKAYDVLIRAAAHLAPRFPGLTVEIYGGVQAGHEQHARALIDLVQRLGLDDVVRFEGHVPCPWKQWVGADAYVLPSHAEGFGLALLEAMSSGLPVVSTLTDGARDLITHRRTGFLVPINDPDSLAAGLVEVLTEPSFARSLGAAARADAIERHTVERFVGATIDAYMEAIGG